VTSNKQPAYKRGKYKPSKKPRADKGTLREGSERWLAQKLGISLHKARKLKKSLEK
jgi:hypothetical protein